MSGNQKNISLLLSAADRFSDPAKRAAGVSEHLASKIKLSSSAVRDLDKKQKDLAAAFKLEATTKKGAAGLAKLEDRIKKTAAAAKSGGKAEIANLKALEAQRKLARNTLASQKTELRGLTQTLRKSGIESGNFGREQRRLASAIDKSSRALKAQNNEAGRGISAFNARAQKIERLQRTAISAAAGGASMLGIGRRIHTMVAAPVTKMRSREDVKSDLAAMGMSNKGIANLSAKADAMSEKYSGITAGGVLSIGAELRAGVHGIGENALTKITESAALAAKSMRTEPELMADIFAKQLSLRSGADKNISTEAFAQQMAGAMVVSQKRFRLRGKDLTKALDALGPALAAGGASFTDRLAMLGIMSNRIKGTKAGSALKALDQNLPKANELFKKRGFSIRTLNKDGSRRNLADLIDDLQARFGDKAENISSEEQKGLTDAFTAQGFDVLKALWGRADELRKAQADLAVGAKEGDAAAKALAKITDSDVSAQMRKLSQRFEKLQLELGQAMIPVLEVALPHLKSFASWLARFVENSPAFSAGIMGAITLMGGIATVGGAALLAIGGLAASAAFATKSLTKLGFSRAADKIGNSKGGGLLGKAARGGAKLLRGASIAGVAGLAGGYALDGLFGEKSMVARLGGAALTGGATGALAGSIIPGAGTLVAGIGGALVGVANEAKNIMFEAQDAKIAKESGLITPETLPQLAAKMQANKTVTDNRQTNISLQVSAPPGNDPQQWAQSLADAVRHPLGMYSAPLADAS